MTNHKNGKCLKCNSSYNIIRSFGGKMRYMVIRVKFEDDVTGEEMQSISSSFYNNNEKVINGMTADILKNEKEFKKFSNMYHRFESE